MVFLEYSKLHSIPKFSHPSEEETSKTMVYLSKNYETKQVLVPRNTMLLMELDNTMVFMPRPTIDHGILKS